MIRHPIALTKIWLHCRSVATAAQPRAPDANEPPLRTPAPRDWPAKPRALDTISYLDKWKPSEPPSLRTPTSKDWSAAKPRTPDTISYLDKWKPSGPPNPLQKPDCSVAEPRAPDTSERPPLRTPAPKDWSAAKPRAPDTSESLRTPSPNDWSATKPRVSDTISYLDSDNRKPSEPPLGPLQKLDRSVAEPRVLDTIESPPLRTPSPKDWSAATPRVLDAIPYLDRRKPSEPPSGSLRKPDCSVAEPRAPDTSERPPLRTPAPKVWSAAKPRAPDTSELIRTPSPNDWSPAKLRVSDTIPYLDKREPSEPPPGPLQKPDRFVAESRALDTSEPSPLRTPTPKVWSRPQQATHPSPTFAETAGAAPPETPKKWSQLEGPSNSGLPQISVLNSDSQPPIVPLAAEKVSQPINNASQPISLSIDSDHSNQSLEDKWTPRPPLRAPAPKIWSRPQPQPIHSSPTLAKTAAPPETLKMRSQPVAPPSNSRLSQIPVLNSISQPSITPPAAKVLQPINNASHPTLSSSDSNLANQSSEDQWQWIFRPEPSALQTPTPKVWSRPQPIHSPPTLAETPAADPHRAASPETLKKWSRPEAPSKSRLSQIPVLNSDSQPSIAPLAAQKVSQPISLPPDSDHVNQSLEDKWISRPPQTPILKVWTRPQQPIRSSPTSTETPAADPRREIRAPFPPEMLKMRSRPVAPSNGRLFQIPVLNSNSQPSMAPPAAQKVLQPAKKRTNASQPTSLSPDSSYMNQALEEKSRPQTPPKQEFSSSLDMDPDDEFADKRLRPETYRRNQKSYLEGRGRFERVPSKVLQQQSANTPLSRKKASSVPKLIKARRMDVFIPSTLSVAMLAKLLNVKLARLQQQMKRAGMESESSYDHILTSDYAVLLAEEFGRNPIVDDEAAFDIHPPVAHPNPSSLPSRPPIVTIMGHVDHGKTTLLDTLRSASVAKGEAGGITQHIGAFSVPVNEMGSASGPQSITFLDTPGHAAFSAMRARGANVTDIIVLVVAADDGIMPQTKEVINLFKRDDSQVSLVVAINKIDKPNVDLDSVKRALMAEGIQVEDFGGDIPAVHVSGLTGEGLPELLETLSLVAEMQDLRAEHTGSVYGHVLESNVQKGLGPVATILVRRGCLKAGTHVLSGLSHAKVRRMTGSNGRIVPVALPGMAVTVSGWKILPKAGDVVLDGSENDIKKAILNRARREELEALHHDVDAINLRRQQHRDLRTSGEDEEPLAPVSSGPLELRLVIKADVSGSAEAVRDALHGIGNSNVRAQVISTGVGEITESDVMMAKAADATIVGFSVPASRSVQNNASQNGVPVCTSDIIYRLVDDIRERVTALLPVLVETKVTGEATILQLFDIDLKQKQTMKIAGCRVTNGIVEKQKFARVLRNGNIIYDGTLSTMRHIKKDITEARKGTECGLGFGEFRDLEAGDLIQMYEKIERPGVI